MNNIIENGIGQSPENLSEAYLLFPDATKRGALNLDEVVYHSVQDASMQAINGLMPKQGAVVNLPGRGIGAIDLVAVRKVDQKIEIAPTSKTDVLKRTGHMNGEGVLALYFPDGTIKLFAAAIEIRRGWDKRTIGNFAIHNFALESLIVERTGEIEDNGIIVTEQPKKIFGGF